MRKEIHKIPKEGRLNEFYVLTTEWYEENVSLTVVDNDMVWTGETDSTKISELCNALHKTKDDFLKELKLALPGNEKEFTFLIEEDNFIVKKIDLKSNIKVKFCSIPLKRIPSIPIFITTLSELLDQDKTNKSNISKLSQDLQDLKAELKNCMEKLQHFASEKASLETILYSKFCEVLNAKKKKITYLESAIGSSHNINTIEHMQLNTAEPVKHTNENYPPPKRMCTKKRVSEEVNPEERESSRTAISQVEFELDKENSDHYDSDTDVETDDESIVNNSANVIKPSFHETAEKGSQRILPKRTTSSILPKRIPHVSDNSIKNQEKPDPIPLNQTERFDDEFNSQSLLEEY